jgi:hypothetical protein
MTSNRMQPSHAQKQGKPMKTNSVQQVFQKYEDIGFLYPAKKQLLAPHFTTITRHWERLVDSKEQLLWILSLTDQKATGNFASISVWKHNNSGLFAQHLVSTGNPFLSLKVMLQAQYIAEHGFSDKEVKSSQNWFRPNNRYAYRIFASMFEKLGPQKASLIRFQYLHLPLELIGECDARDLQSERVYGKDEELIRFVKEQYGEVFARAEELDHEDIQLKEIGNTYKQYDLDLRREVIKARDRRSGKIRACVVANRAPLGLNFSFLENRAYYILDKSLSEKERERVLRCINEAIQPTYQDLAIHAIPIVTDAQTAEVLEKQGAAKLREYMQSIWMREGFRQWYEHIASFLKRIERKR